MKLHHLLLLPLATMTIGGLSIPAHANSLPDSNLIALENPQTVQNIMIEYRKVLVEITQLTKSGNEARRGYNLTLAALEKSLKDAQVSPAASANLRDRIEQLDGQVKYYKREVDITGANREQALQKLKLINQERNRIKADYSNEIKKLTQEIDFIRKQARLLD